MDVAVNLRLLDQLSGPAARATEQMNRLRAAVKGVNPSGIDRTTRAVATLSATAERAAARMQAIRGKAMGVVGGAFGLGLALKEGADWELALRRYAQIAGLSGSGVGTKVLDLNKFMVGMARDTRSGSTGLLQAMTTMTNLGMAASEAELAIKGIGRTSVASGADADELARSFQAVSYHLGLSASKAEEFFNVAHTAGKMGGFELRDMARFFPSMFANLGALYGPHIARETAGMSPEAAQAWKDQFALRKAAQVAGWAQIVRLGAGDSFTAGTNMMNMYQKNMISETSKHFEKHLGMDFKDALWGHVNKGGDPIEFVAANVARLIEKNKGNPLFLGNLFADKQAMEGYLPVIAKYMNKHGELATFMEQIRKAASSGVINKDWLSTIESLTFRFKFFTQTVKDFWKQFGLLGAGGPIGSVFEFLGQRIADLNLLMLDNPGIAGGIIKTIGAIAAVLGGSVVLRYLMAAGSLFMARAGMGAIGLLRIIPGLVPIVSVMAGMMGPLAKLGLVAHGGVLAYAHWDKISPLFGGFGARLRETFPQAFDWLTATALPKLHGWLGLTRDAATGLAVQLGQIGVAAYDGLRYLFTGAGSAMSATAAKDGLLGLGTSLSESMPGLQKLQDWWGQYRRELKFQDAWMKGFGAWLKTFGVGFGVLSAWAVGTHGMAGFLLILAAARSLIFVIGMLVAALNVLATLGSLVFAPLIESLLDSKAVRAAIAGFARMLSIAMGGVALSLYTFGWDGTKQLLAGIYDRFTTETAGAWANLKQRWSELWITVFGIETDAELRQRMERHKEWGTVLGSYLGAGLQKAADALEQLTYAMQRFKVVHPDAFDFLTGWGGQLLQFFIIVGIGVTVLGTLGRMLRFVIGGLVALSGIPALARWGAGAYGLGTGAAAGAAGAWASRGWMAGRLASMGVPAAVIGSALGIGAYNQSRTGMAGSWTGAGGAGPGGMYLDIHQRRAMQPGMSPNDIVGTGKDVASGIQQGGNAIVGALNAVASAIFNAIGGLGTAAGVAARSRGALSDGGGYAGGSGGYGP